MALTVTQRHGEKGDLVGRGLRTRRSEGLDRMTGLTKFTSSYALRDSGVTRVSELARCRLTACVIRCANAPVSIDSPGV
jgi:hypothetical protein